MLANRYVDLETGHIHLPPVDEEGTDYEAFSARRQFTRGSGSDVVFTIDESMLLAGFDLVLYPLGSDWSDIDPQRIVQDPLLRNVHSGTETFIPRPAKIPASFGFRTREGSLGLLQVVAIDESSETIRIRYQLVPGDPKALPVKASKRLVVSYAVLGPGGEKDRHEVVDLATGEMFLELLDDQSLAGLSEGDFICGITHPGLYHPLLFGQNASLAVICVRGATLSIWDGRQYVAAPSEAAAVRGVTTYSLGEMAGDRFPIRFRITTREGKAFDLQLIGLDEKKKEARFDYSLADESAAQDGAARKAWKNVKWSGEYDVAVPIDAKREQYFTLGDGRVFSQDPTDPPTWSIVRDPKLADQVPSDLVLRFHGIHTSGAERAEGIRLWENRPAGEHARTAAGFFGELPFERHGLYTIRRDALPLTIYMTYYGLLQVTEVIDGDAPRVKVRYKLMETVPNDSETSATNGSDSSRQGDSSTSCPGPFCSNGRT